MAAGQSIIWSFIVGQASKVKSKAEINDFEVPSNPISMKDLENEEMLMIAKYEEELQKQLEECDDEDKKLRIKSLLDFPFTLKNVIKNTNDLRSGKINCLITTSVSEEGIDIPKCNIVITFDEPSSSKSFIQLKGRARKADSKFIILCEASNNENSKLEYEAVLQKFKLMREVSQEMAKEPEIDPEFINYTFDSKILNDSR